MNNQISFASKPFSHNNINNYKFLFVVHCFNVSDNFFHTPVDVINFFLDSGTDVDFHNLNDDGIEDPEEHVQYGVDQPVGEDVAGKADAETTARKKEYFIIRKILAKNLIGKKYFFFIYQTNK